MTNNKLVVTLLIITILLSVITIGVTVSSHSEEAPTQDSENFPDSDSANVGLTILPNTDDEVPNETN